MLAIAGVAKLLDQPGTRRSLVDFQAPARLASVLALALPVVELVIAAALLAPRLSQWAAAAALVLLVIFSSVVTRALVHGTTADCNCFGSLTHSTVGWRTLVRNAALGALAAFAAFGTSEGAGALAWIDDVVGDESVAAAVVAILLTAVIGLSWFSWQLLRQNGRLLVRLDAQAEELGGGGPPPAAGVGEDAPRFARADVDGEPVSLDSLLSRRQPAVLLFSHSDCGACEPALAAAAEAQLHRADQVTVAIVNRGDAGLLRRKVQDLGLASVIDDADGSLFTAFRVAAVPAAQLIDARGRVASLPAEGEEAVRSLLAGVGRREPLPAVVEVGAR